MSFAAINGTVLHYRVSGTPGGMPLILVNSLGTSLDIWDEVLPALEPSHRVLTYDKRGHGLSDAPAGPYGIDDHVADLIGLANTCGFTSVALCGISIGGMIALRVAAKYPQLVRRLVLCDTAPAIGTEESWNGRIAAVRQGGMAAIADGVLERWVSPGFRTARPTDFAGWRNMLERCPVEGYVASCATVRDTDLGADVGNITAPTLVIVGENDLSTPPEQARQLATTIDGATFRLVSGAGHVPSIEQPEPFAELIRAHLSEAAHA